MTSGPLSGIKVVEFAGIGPGPFCGMLLADLGADVLRIDRMETVGRPSRDIMGRGKRSVGVDLKSAAGIETALDLIEKADVLLEGFRPGVMERLGLGPAVALERNPRLVYGRMTGWGQTGPLSHSAGHDINYIALTGALHAMGRRGEPPAPPLNLVGDFGGGALYLAFGICAALLEARSSGRGQVIDCAMTDGAASLMTMFYGMKASGMWSDERDANLLDGAAHFYDCYTCKCGGWLAIGAIEPQFHALLIPGLGLDPADFSPQMDPSRWPEYSARIAQAVSSRTRDEWMAQFEGTDACVAPVLSMTEAPLHRHNVARATFETAFGVLQPSPAPRFSRTPGAIRSAPPEPGAHTRSALADWGMPSDDIETLIVNGVIAALPGR